MQFHVNLVLTFMLSLMVINAAWSAGEDRNDGRRLIEQDRFSQEENQIRQQLKNDPGNPDLRFQLARLLAWQGKYKAAIAEYDGLLAQYPDNSDYLLGKGQTLFWAKRGEEALPLLETARTNTPDYLDVWQLEIRILQASQDESDRTKAQQLLAEAKQRFPQQQWDDAQDVTKQPEPVDISYTEVEAGFDYDNLDNNFDDWSSLYLLGEHQYNNAKKIYAAAFRTERFSQKDEEYLLGFYSPIHTAWGMVLEGSVSPAHRVRPRWSAFAQIQRVFPQGWNGYLGLRTTKYNETDTRAMSLTAERYWRAYRFSYTGYATQVSGEAIATDTFATHLFAMDYYYSDRNQVGLALSKGKELEYNGTPNPPISDIVAVVVKGRYWFTPQWAISYDLHFHEQGDIYTRHGYRLGIRYRY